MSADYLEFKYRYNLIVEDNSEGFEWKPMRLCTESKVLLDKHKVIQYFNLSAKYSIYKIRVLKQYNSEINYKDVNRLNIWKYARSGWRYFMEPENRKMFNIGEFFIAFFDRIFDETNFAELSSLVVNGNEIFECSAKLHYKNQSIDSNAMVIENCFEYFRIKTTVIANNSFGVCYEFFENDSSIFLKEDDFIKLKIKFEKQKDFIISYFLLNMFIIEFIPQEIWQYFQWYYFINEQSIASKSSLITSKRIGLSAELKISKTSIKLLSVPYMTFCEHFECRHDFYKLSLDNNFFDYNNDTFIEIKHNRKINLIYNAEPSLEFVDFISNIGGLFALYFGLSFIDISDILKLITRRITFHLQRLLFYRKVKALIQYLKLSHVEILKYIKLIPKIPWKMVLTIVSSPFFVSQMFELIINYFQYSTQISFEFNEYEQKNQKISINEFPAITVCTEHMLEKAFFDPHYIDWNKIELKILENGYNRDQYGRVVHDGVYCKLNSYVYREENNLNFSNINIDILNFMLNYCEKNFKTKNLIRYLSKYSDIKNKEEYNQVMSRIEDKHINGLNETLDLLDFYVNQHNCRTLYEPNIDCQDLKPTIKMLSPFGKCHTYLMGDYNNKTYVDKIIIYTGDYQDDLRIYLRRNFILHSSNHLPIWTSNQFRATDVSFDQDKSLVVRISKNELIKLPPPYDNKCHDYSERQQFECMNKCVENYYKDKLKCFPNKNNYHTILVDDQIFKKNYVFCNNSENIWKKNKLFARYCNSLCGVPCSKTYFNEEVIPSSMQTTEKKTHEKFIEFIIDNVEYLKIIWLPKLTIISLFIKIFNIWSLWHGIHFKLLIDLILEYVKQVYSYVFRKIVINIDWKNYINYQITKVRII